ncbi:MAG: hypothetical protein V4586_01680 [Pseudomonadota bacterium]
MADIKKRESSTSLSFSTEGFDRAIYADVAMKARLRELALSESEFSAKIDVLRLAEMRHEDMAHTFGGECTDFSFDSESGIAFGNYAWTAEMKHGRTKVLKLKCKYLLVYSNLKSCPQDYVGLYFEKVGRFSSYPYFRTVFASHTSFAGAAVKPLPSLTERID